MLKERNCIGVVMRIEWCHKEFLPALPTCQVTLTGIEILRGRTDGARARVIHGFIFFFRFELPSDTPHSYKSSLVLPPS
jgi:hypothetical protein